MRMEGRIFLLVIILLSFVLATGCSSGDEEEPVEERVMPVKVEKATFGSLTGENVLNGSIVAEEESDVVPQAMGEIKKLHVKKGDHVKRGDLLAELDSTEADNAVKQQELALKQAETGLKTAQNGKKAAESNLKQSKSSLTDARSALKSAKESKGSQPQLANVEQTANQTIENFNLVEELFNEGIISEADYKEMLNSVGQAQELLKNLQQGNVANDMATGVESLKSAVKQAETGVQMAENTVTDTVMAIEQAEVGVEQARLAVDAAKKAVEATKIKAPIAGEIVDLPFKEGDMTSQQAAFAKIASVDKVKIIFNVLPEMLDQFSLDDKVKVQIGKDEALYEASITYLSSVSMGSGLFEVEAKIESENKKIRPGMVALVKIDEELVTDTVLVPTKAIVQQEGLDVVFVVEDDRAVRKEIEIVHYGTDMTAVKGDIEKDDLIVTSGQNLLEDGHAVKIMEED